MALLQYVSRTEIIIYLKVLILITRSVIFIYIYIVTSHFLNRAH